MSISLEYCSESRISSFYSALDSVAREQIYIEMIQAPDFSKFEDFIKKQIINNWPAYFEVDGDRVVGWADVTPSANPRLAHRGGLGMGVIASHRKQGLGRRLLDAVVEHSKRIGLEKIELSVYTENLSAIALYQSAGFEKKGLIKRYRKLEGRYFDCLSMAKFL
jgi:RimJ/RimL family protein N-acetyltransferase